MYEAQFCRAIEKQLLETSSEMLLCAIRDAVAEISPETHGSTISVSTMSVKEICSDARSFLGEYMSTAVWLDMEDFLCSALSSLKNCEAETDELDLLSLLSTTKMFVGLVQAYLMWPTPVDPIVTARTKYQCLKNLVSKSTR